jgi:citrate lyase beta subunit
VWEYFGPECDGKWDVGLAKELELDRLNGFIGKTAIHPSQLPLIHESMKVKKSDYDDAMKILDWNNGSLGVAKSEDGSRMNEVKVHGKWAGKIAVLGEIYGVKE